MQGQDKGYIPISLLNDARELLKMEDDIQCPVCGYYCLGKGGHDCIDKPSLILKSRPKSEAAND